LTLTSISTPPPLRKTRECSSEPKLQEGGWLHDAQPLQSLHSPHGHGDGASPPPFFLFSHNCTPMSGVRARGPSKPPGRRGIDRSRWANPRFCKGRVRTAKTGGATSAGRVTRSVFFSRTEVSSYRLLRWILDRWMEGGEGGHMRGRDLDFPVRLACSGPWACSVFRIFLVRDRCHGAVFQLLRFRVVGNRELLG
jgi:hypothetical protein